MNKVTANTDHLEDVRAQLGSADYDTITAEAQLHQDAEHTLTLGQALRRYPKAVMWSVILSGAMYVSIVGGINKSLPDSIMEGFDLVLISSLFAQPQFQRKYGIELADGSYTIESRWQIGLNLAVQAGSIIGLMLNGWASERFGYRKTILTALVMMIAVIFIPFFAQNIQTLFAGQLLAGIPWGTFQTLTTAYASEVVPVALRPYLTAYVNLCWVIGQLIASGTLRGVLDWQAEWAFRLPFALQWVWPPLILVPCLFAPDSPWWLVRKGRLDQARKAVRRLRSNPTDLEVDQQIAFMQHTNALEQSVSEGTSYISVFKGVDLRRTEVAIGAWIAQNWCGSSFMGWSTYFLERAGLATSNAFTMTIVQYALGAVGTVVSWGLMSRVGRRTLYLSGLSIQTVLLLIIGGLGFASRSSMGASWGIGALLLVYTAVYDATVGPVCYALVAECSSTRLRAKTIVVARIVYNLAGIINFIKMPYFLNADELDLGGKVGLYWGGLCLLCLIWTYFRCPEMKGRTYGELEVLFESRVPARKFASTHVDQFAGAHTSEPKVVEETSAIEDVDAKRANDGEVHVSKA